MKPVKIVLVVDDNSEWRSIMAEAVKRAGLQPILAATRLEATDILSNFPVDIAMIDLSLSQDSGAPLEGLTLISKLYREYVKGRSRPIVIAISGSKGVGAKELGKFSIYQERGFVVRSLHKDEDLDDDLDEALKVALNRLLDVGDFAKDEKPLIDSNAVETGIQVSTTVRTELTRAVFLSYCSENRDEVRRLRQALIDNGEAVWWDQDILPGQDWKFEVKNALKNSYAVIACLSKEAQDRKTAGIYPELRDAIDKYRQYAPGSIFIIPVRLSECQIPPLEIDATRTLDELQYVDLFPPSNWTDGIGRLLNALRTAPHHP